MTVLIVSAMVALWHPKLYNLVAGGGSVWDVVVQPGPVLLLFISSHATVCFNGVFSGQVDTVTLGIKKILKKKTSSFLKSKPSHNFREAKKKKKRRCILLSLCQTIFRYADRKLSRLWHVVAMSVLAAC